MNSIESIVCILLNSANRGNKVARSLVVRKCNYCQCENPENALECKKCEEFFSIKYFLFIENPLGKKCPRLFCTSDLCFDTKQLDQLYDPTVRDGIVYGLEYDAMRESKEVAQKRLLEKIKYYCRDCKRPFDISEKEKLKLQVHKRMKITPNFSDHWQCANCKNFNFESKRICVNCQAGRDIDDATLKLLKQKQDQQEEAKRQEAERQRNAQEAQQRQRQAQEAQQRQRQAQEAQQRQRQAEETARQQQQEQERQRQERERQRAEAKREKDEAYIRQIQEIEDIEAAKMTGKARGMREMTRVLLEVMDEFERRNMSFNESALRSFAQASGIANAENNDLLNAVIQMVMSQRKK